MIYLNRFNENLITPISSIQYNSYLYDTTSFLPNNINPKLS